MRPSNDTERNYDHEAALARAAQLLDALIDEGIAPELKEKLQCWFVGDMSVKEKYSALEKLFMELEPNLEPDSYEYEQLRKTCRALGFGRRRRVPLGHVAMRVAAVVVAVFAIAGIAWLWNDMRPQRFAAADVWVSAPEGATKRVVLPDGSQVWLNGPTRLGYNDGFEKGRSVTLDGEAYFEVERDTLSPFRVQSGEMMVEVLGTEFSVRGRAGEQQTEVVLASGSVRVAPTGDRFVELVPNERLTYDAVLNEAVIEIVDVDEATPWRIDDLRMTDMPIAEALRRIGAYYGMEVVIHGTSGDLVNLDPGDELSLRQVLDVVSAISGGFGYEVTEDEIIVTLD